MASMQFTLVSADGKQIDQWEKQYPEIYRAYGDLTHAVCEKLQHLYPEGEMIKDVKIRHVGRDSDPQAPDMVGSECPDSFPKEEDNSFVFTFKDGAQYNLTCKKV